MIGNTARLLAQVVRIAALRVSKMRVLRVMSAVLCVRYSTLVLVEIVSWGCITKLVARPSLSGMDFSFWSCFQSSCIPVGWAPFFSLSTVVCFLGGTTGRLN